MNDLYLGLGTMTVLMGIMFVFARLLTRTAPMWVVDALAALEVVLIAVYARWIWDETFVAQWLPYSNLIVVSNWFPMAAGFLAGLVWRRIGDRPAKFLGLGKGEYGSTPRKFLAASVLFVAGILSAAWPLFGRTPVCGHHWEGDICFQTTDATCSAAAGATLLQQYGVYVSEQVMAELCLTRDGTRWRGIQLTRRGTNWKGLYRALSIKGREAGREVQASQLSIDELLDNFTEPVILQCELLVEEFSSDSRYDLSGWVRGQSHSVVLLDVFERQGETMLMVSDPSLKDVYVEFWTRKDLATLWHGQVLRLVRINEE
jgi:hypothetical protein